MSRTDSGFLSHRYDKEGHSMEGQSLTEMRSGGGGGNTNWKTLTDVKTEHLGHGEKVHTPFGRGGSSTRAQMVHFRVRMLL